MTALSAELADFRARHPLRECGPLGYRAGGDAGSEAVLFLPGFLGGAESWCRLWPALPEGRRLLAVDYPAVAGAEALLALLEDLLASEGIERVSLVGQSLGGLLAPVLAQRLPGRVRSLALCHAAPPKPQELPSLRWRVRLGAWIPMAYHRAQWRKRLQHEHEGELRTFFLECLASLDAATFHGLGRCYRDLVALGAAGSTTPLPTLLVGARDDPAVTPRDRAALGALHRGAAELELPRAGHASPLVEPAAVAAGLIDLWSRS